MNLIRNFLALFRVWEDFGKGMFIPRKTGNRLLLYWKGQSYHVEEDPTTLFFPLELSFAIEIHGTGHSACTYTCILSAVGCTPRNCTEIPASAGICDRWHIQLSASILPEVVMRNIFGLSCDRRD